jgi:VWFA-related protein
MKSQAALLSLLFALPLLPAQAPATDSSSSMPDPDSYTLKQEVRNVVVDVIVTDKHGKPVMSLDKAHFKVTENGVPQDVSFFEEHNTGDGTANPPAQPAPALPANVHTNIATGPADGPLMVLLLDALNTPIADQAYVRYQMIEYLKQIPAGTHMAIFTLGDKLQLIQGFTGDPAVLKAALDGKAYPATPALIPAGMSGGGSAEGLRLGGVMVALPSAVAETRSSLDRFANESESFGQELRIRYTLDALNALAVYLDGIEGRKNLVWFAGSVPWTINPDFSLVSGVTGRVDYADELKKLADVMTVGRIAIYPIDARGLVTPAGYAADNPGSAFASRGNGGAFGRQEMNSQMTLAGEHMSMANLASATGGRALYNTNGLSGAVLKVQAIGENYYTLAYSPTDKRYDGGFRQLDIKTTDPGLKLEYRRGYYAYDPAKATGRSVLVHSNPLRAVMQRGAPDATQIPFHVEVKVAARQPDRERPSDRLGNQAATLKGPLVRYDFHWNVDLSRIEFASTASGLHHAEIDATLTAYDADGKVLNTIYAVLPLNLNNADYALYLKSGLPMKQTLDVPAGVVYLRAGVLDPSDGHTGATEFPLAVEPMRASLETGAGPVSLHR